MLEGMSPEQIRRLVTHGMDAAHIEVLDKVLALAESFFDKWGKQTDPRGFKEAARVSSIHAA